MANKNDKQRVLDGIEALFPADASSGKKALIGQVLLKYALENTPFNWRELPQEVLERYLAICEDYELRSEQNQNTGSLPGYLRH